MSNYCFWIYKQKHPYDHSNKEIARLLGVSQSNVRSTWTNALIKLQQDDDVKTELPVLLGDYHRSEPIDESIYDTDTAEGESFWSRHEGSSYGMNVNHGSGKAQIYGLSSNWWKHVDKQKIDVSK